MTTEIRIRYSRPLRGLLGRSEKGFILRGPPKDTLATKRVDAWVFFGIARCNKVLDTFRRKEGRKIAIERLEKAINTGIDPETSLWISADGLYGCCAAYLVPFVLNYFEDLEIGLGPKRLEVSLRKAGADSCKCCDL